MANDPEWTINPTAAELPLAVEVEPDGSPWGRRLLIGAVLSWFAILILVPGAALAKQALGGGVAAMFAALNQPEVYRAFALSLGLAAVATVLNTIFGVALALVLVRQRFWGRALLDGVVDMPFAISPIIAGLMLVVLYGPDSIIGGWLEERGIQVVYALPGMVLATMFVTVPFVTRELVPVLRELGEEYEQAAHTLGAGRWRTFWSVTLPSIRWGVAYGVTLTIARCLGEFGAVLVVSGNIIGRTQTATLYIADGVESFHPEGAYAASLVLAAVSFCLLVGMDLIRRRLDRGKGVKP